MSLSLHFALLEGTGCSPDAVLSLLPRDTSRAVEPDFLTLIDLDRRDECDAFSETRAAIVRSLPFRLPHGLIDCLRLSTKVIFQISDPCGAKREHIQWLAVAMYGLWVYDYFLTLGDEVRRS